MILSKTGFCEEKLRLMEEFLSAATDFVTAHDEQVQALIGDDTEFGRFDLLIHLASERRQKAKSAYLSHLEDHGC